MPTTGYYFGGTIPYYCDGNEHYILLGKEYKDNKWSSFGGRREAGETVLDLIVRESWEETGGLLGTKECLSNQVRESNYALLYKHQRNWSLQVFIPICPVLADYLPKQFESINSYQNHCNTGWFQRTGCQEKTAIQWFPLTAVICASKGNGLIFNDPKYPVRDVFDLSMVEAKVVRDPFRDGADGPEKYIADSA